MPFRSSQLLRLASAASLLAIVAACTASPEPGETRVSSTSKAKSGRWSPPESDATGTYEGLKGEGCAGGLKPGTEALGEQLKQQFDISYGGYSCRANTGNTSQLSIHAVGRALDITASGSKGDQIADFLVENAESLGIQLIIWNRTVWMISGNGPTSKAYSGPNPHTDHVHAEVNSATAANGPGGSKAPTGADPNDPNGSMNPNDPGYYPNDPGYYPNDPNAYPNDPNAYPNDPNAPNAYPYDPNNPGQGGNPYGGDWNPDEEIECRTAVECDPSGSVRCVEGFCDYWDPGY